MKRLLICFILATATILAQVGTFPPAGGSAASDGDGCVGLTEGTAGLHCMDQGTSATPLANTAIVQAGATGNLEASEDGGAFARVCTASNSVCAGSATSVTTNYGEWSGGLPYCYNCAGNVAATFTAGQTLCAVLKVAVGFTATKINVRMRTAAPGGTGVAAGLFTAAGAVLNQATVVAPSGQPQLFTITGTALTAATPYYVCVGSESATTELYASVDSATTLDYYNASTGGLFFTSTGASGSGAGFALPSTLTLTRSSTVAKTFPALVMAN